METLKLHPLVLPENWSFRHRISLSLWDTTGVFASRFVIRRGERTALQGPTAAGSTLFQLLLGNQKVSEGTLVMEQGLKISYVPQDTSF
ncbi:MAG: hypothetical protein ACLVJ6_03090 [Merdibacter sp.]